MCGGVCSVRGVFVSLCVWCVCVIVCVCVCVIVCVVCVWVIACACVCHCVCGVCVCVLARLLCVHCENPAADPSLKLAGIILAVEDWAAEMVPAPVQV